MLAVTYVWSSLIYAVLGYTALYFTLKLAAERPRQASPQERLYLDAKSQQLKQLRQQNPEKSLATVDLSVIIPAYNEESRLPIMLKETIEYLDNRQKQNKDFTYEIIVVDDGSKDHTTEIAQKQADQAARASNYHTGELRVMKMRRNRGKGGAVTQGMLCARGSLLLFADADGATRFADLAILEERIKVVTANGCGLAIGSRAHMVSSDAVVKRSFVRNLLMHGFHTVLLVFGIRDIKDTQCGFKLVTRKAAAMIFPNLHSEGWIFDIELLLICQYLSIGIAEVPVNWHEVEGTKMSLLKDSAKMLIDLLLIRLNYITRVWTVQTTGSEVTSCS